MKESLFHIIEELCFKFGEGFPEKDKENFDEYNREWFNLSYYEFSFRIDNITLESIGHMDESVTNRVIYNERLVYEYGFIYVDDDSPAKEKLGVYIPGEWEDIIYKKYRDTFPLPSEQMDFADISDQFSI